MSQKVGRSACSVAAASALAAVLAAFLVGCSGMPVPSEKKSSMFVLMAENPEYSSQQEAEWTDVLVFDGPTPFTIEVRPLPRRLFFRAVEPGDYRVEQRYVRLGGGIRRRVPFRASFTIAPDAVHLFPQKILDMVGQGGSPLPGSLEMSPDDQRWSAEEVSDYLSFREWIGSEFEGFGPYRPRFSLEQKSYAVRVDSQPAGAAVSIDDVDWGTAPVTAGLAPGKHRVRLEKDGFAPTQTYLTVEADTEVVYTLTPVGQAQGVQAGAVGKGERIRLLVAPFQNIGPPEHERWAPVLLDAVTVDLEADERLLVVAPEGVEVPAGGPGFRPDFSEAERRGAELLIAGQYWIDGGRLLVHAALFDVRREMVKASVTYQGEAGAAVFESVDEMSRRFREAVDRSLPEVGREVVENREQMRGRIVAYDKKLTENQIVEKRLERRFSLSAGALWGAVIDTLDAPPHFEGDMRYPEGPALGASLTGELTLYGPLSLAMMFNPVYLNYARWTDGGLAFELPLYLGPRFSFMGTKNDLYFSLLGQLRYVTPVTLTDDEFGQTGEFGPYWITGMSVDTGFKFYLYNRMSAAPLFINFGMLFGVFQSRFQADFSGPEGVPLEMWLYLGFGSRL